MTSRWRGGFPTPALSLCFFTSVPLALPLPNLYFPSSNSPPSLPHCLFGVFLVHELATALTEILQKLQPPGCSSAFFPALCLPLTLCTEWQWFARRLLCRHWMSAWLSAWHLGCVPVFLSVCLSISPDSELVCHSIQLSVYQAIFQPVFLPNTEIQTRQVQAGHHSSLLLKSPPPPQCKSWTPPLSIALTSLSTNYKESPKRFCAILVNSVLYFLAVPAFFLPPLSASFSFFFHLFPRFLLLLLLPFFLFSFSSPRCQSPCSLSILDSLSLLSLRHWGRMKKNGTAS